MATRATYQVEGECFYCHWDGYPTGAASRFAKMIAAMTQPAPADDYRTIEERRGGPVFAFIRGNFDAEPTSGRDRHGDTEWHYEVWRNRETGHLGIHISERSWVRSQDWKGSDTRELADWINEQRRLRIGELKSGYRKTAEEAEAIAAEEIPEVLRVTFEHETTYATRAAAEQIAANEEARALRYGEENPNRAHSLNRAAAWRKALEG